MTNVVDRFAISIARLSQIVRILAAASALLGAAALTAGPIRAADLTLTETGSTLLKPLFDIWVPEYLKNHPGVQIVTAATGSGAGQHAVLATAAPQAF